MKRNKNKPMPSSSAVLKRKRGLQMNSLLVSLPENRRVLDFQSPENLLASILSPACSMEHFLHEFWEKQPLLITRSVSPSYYVNVHLWYKCLLLQSKVLQYNI